MVTIRALSGSRIMQTLVTRLAVPHGREAEAIKFYGDALDARVVRSNSLADGAVVAAELRIGESNLIIHGASPRRDRTENLGPRSASVVGTTTCSLLVRVLDADIALAKAVNAGADARGAVDDTDEGGRAGCFTDPFGHIWMVAT
jgi:PhnB protein